MQIIQKGEFVTLPGGLKVPRPTSADYREAEATLREQEKLFNELCRLGSDELSQGRALSIQRQVARLERMKHPCLTVLNSHLFPEEYGKLIGTH